MAYQSRVTTFSDGTFLPASALNGEFDPIYDLLAGTANKNVKLIYNAADIPNLILNNTGSGVLFQAQVAGVSKLEISAAGVLDSKVTTGTAPIEVDSTTVCPNLNADLLDGMEASAFVTVAGDYLVDAATVRIDGASSADQVFEIKAPSARAAEVHWLPNVETQSRVKLSHGGSSAVMVFHRDDGASGWDEMIKFRMGFGDDATIGLMNSAGTSEAQVLNTRDHSTPFTHHQEYAGSFWSSSTFARRFVYSDDHPTISVTKVQYVYQTGSPTGNSTLHVKKYNAAGTEQLSRTVTLNSGDTAGQAYEVNITDFDLDTDGDQLAIVGVTNNGHADISVQVIGSYEFEVV